MPGDRKGDARTLSQWWWPLVSKGMCIWQRIKSRSERYTWWEGAELGPEVENGAQIQSRIGSGGGRNILRIAVSECHRDLLTFLGDGGLYIHTWGCIISKSFLILFYDLFPLTQEVPDPTKYFVTRWSTDPWIQMAYSFVKTGGSGEAYDIIAEEIQGTIFFAGEVCIMIANPITFILITFF